jgi:hypothetical protein
MFFWNKICGLMALFFILTPSLYAQNSIDFKVQNDFLLKNKSIPFDSVHLIFPSASRMATSSKQTISPDFATCKYGFFCRQELKIEKATKFPIRIRLGSLQQCNYYEGKP